MKDETKNILRVALIIAIASTAFGCLCMAIVDRQASNYETGVTITPNPEYRIELFYSDETCTGKGFLILEFRPRLFKSRNVIVGNYTAEREMHLWHWRLVYGDKKVFSENIDRDVKVGYDIKFIYVVDE